MEDLDQIGQETAPEEVSPEEEPGASLEAEGTEPEETLPASRDPRHLQAALREEREERKRLRSELEQAKTERAAMEARVEERLRMLQESMTPKEPEPQAPVYEEDPEGYVRFMAEKHERELGQMRQQEQQRQTQAQQAQQVNQVMSAYMGAAQEFAGRTPDFQEAYKHLLEREVEELNAAGFTDPQVRDAILKNKEFGIVQQAMARGANPAEVIYNLAKVRGWQPGKSNAQGLGREKAAAKASASLGAVSGSATENLTAEALLSMSDDDFAAATRGKKWQKVMR